MEIGVATHAGPASGADDEEGGRVGVNPRDTAFIFVRARWNRSNLLTKAGRAILFWISWSHNGRGQRTRAPA